MLKKYHTCKIGPRIMEDIKNALICNTCNMIVDIPLTITCCKQELHCLKCLYKAYVCNDKPSDIFGDNLINSYVESLNKCKCSYLIRETNTRLPLLVKHTGEYAKIKIQNLLIPIRNAINEKMTCAHFPYCQETFMKCNDLDYHLKYTCKYAPKHCSKNGCTCYNYKFIIDKHEEIDHKYIECHVCQEPIAKSLYKYHIAEHGSQLMLTTYEGYLSKCLVSQDVKKFSDVTHMLHSNTCQRCNPTIQTNGNFCTFIDKMIQSFE